MKPEIEIALLSFLLALIGLAFLLTAQLFHK